MWNIVKKTCIGGTAFAIYKDLKSLFFNVKSALLHLISYMILSLKKLDNVSLHFGCGSDYKEGFINLDMNQVADFYLDARNKLPFKNDTVNKIYSSHFVEHLTNEELMQHFREVYRVLKPGGTYRICVPDFVRAIKHYLKRDQDRVDYINQKYPLKYAFLPKNLLSYGDHLDRGLHSYGNHKVFLDFEKVRNMLRHAGFSKDSVCLVEFDKAIDVEDRKEFSIYIEAKKT